jgi:hypothetical protein
MERGAFELAVNFADVGLLMQIPRSERPKLRSQRWKVPRSLSWEQLRDHYAAQLGPGWSIDKRFPERGSDYLSTVWRYDGPIWWWDQRPIYAIVYVDIPAAYGFAVLTTYRPDL